MSRIRLQTQSCTHQGYTYVIKRSVPGERVFANNDLIETGLRAHMTRTGENSLERSLYRLWKNSPIYWGTAS
jgi:hypothetical protein